MVQFVCNLLGLSYSGLSVGLQTVIIVCSCVLIFIFCDIIIRCFVSPVFALMGRLNNKK